MDEEEEEYEEKKYVKIIWKNPNPLFVKWITEWMEEARRRNMQLQYTLEKALESLKKFPIPLKSGKECLILEHFGSALCHKLDRELAKYNATKLDNAANPPAIPGPSTSGINRLDIKDIQEEIKNETESTDKPMTLLKIEKSSPKKLFENGKAITRTKNVFEIDKPSPKKLFEIDNPSPKKVFQTKLSSAVGSSTERPLDLSAPSTSGLNYPKPKVERNAHNGKMKEKLSDSLQACNEILKELLSKKHSGYAWPFYKPVDAELISVHDYHLVIKKPMDLGTVKQKMRNREYRTASEFAADVRLIFTNCYKYNPPDDDIVGMGHKLQDIIELLDNPSLKKVTEISSTKGSSTERPSNLSAPSTSGLNLPRPEVEKNVQQLLVDIETARNVAPTSPENITAMSRKQTTGGPDRRRCAEDRPPNSAFAPRNVSALGIAGGSSTYLETFSLQAKAIGTSPAKRKLDAPSLERSPFKPNPPANPFLFADDNDTAPLSQLSSIGSCSQTQEEQFTHVPGDFKIRLLVDTAETFGHTAKRWKREEEATAYLTELGVPFEVRRLTVGDFVWVCQDAASARELLLPYIVERKRADDLAKSIKDGRFREQKFRLKQLPIAERIYLVEELKRKDRPGLPFSTLMQAATNTQLVDGFKVKFTNNLKHSMQYLATMTEFLTEAFSKKILLSCPKDQLPPFNMKDDSSHLMTFKDFTRNTAKKRKYTVGEMFLKHLLQLRGMSVEKAKAVVSLYPTPSHLMEAYRDCEPSKKRMMLAKLRIGALGRYLGPVLSVAIHDFYTKNEFS
ncbi:hypothetical protein LSTR_LSTR009241 [Laodelphax striatellus]|uniref:Crossover junction endonuclease MUS81 n=1 Tax=Laodelphax striatellus TaxID=195883 RepID=A0A482XCR8_LAOST|nr:hypothetical protein LSTR_LSTR009241 [Laodelphax striatellus]